MLAHNNPTNQNLGLETACSQILKALELAKVGGSRDEKLEAIHHVVGRWLSKPEAERELNIETLTEQAKNRFGYVRRSERRDKKRLHARWLVRGSWKAAAVWPESESQQQCAIDRIFQVAGTVLKAREFSVFVLTWKESMEVEEIAKMIGRSSKTVYRLLRKARQKISKAMSAEEATG
jgi:RNA polymerase sigma factor (sigma-70 family)